MFKINGGINLVKVLMLISDGFEEIEAISVVDILRRCGIKLEICSVTESNTLESCRNVKILADTTINKLKDMPADYMAVILPGGLPNADTLRDNENVISILKMFNEKGLIVAAICAAPKALERAGLLKGKRATSYPGSIDENKCIYVNEAVVVDGNIITSRGAGSAAQFSFSIAKELGLNNIADKVYKAMLF